MVSNIIINYQLWNESTPKVLELTQEKYYDLPETDDISFDKDRIAKYSDPHEYLHVKPTDLMWLTLKVPSENNYDLFKYQYLNGTDSIMIHSIFQNGDEELIHSVVLPDGNVHTIRTLKKLNGNWSTTMNSIDSQIEGKYHPFNLIKKWTFKELLEFIKLKL